jgi:hypothetical protein
MLLAREREHSLESLLEAVRAVHSSPFCRGEVGDGRKADIMLILQPKTLPRILEGFYGGDAAKRHEPSVAERIEGLERAIVLYERDGRADYLETASRQLAELKALPPEDPAIATNVVRLIGSVAREKSTGRVASR